jgi:hypothetical protein
MQSLILKQTQERQYQTVRNNIYRKLCKSILSGTTCTVQGCSFIHSINQFKTDQLCEFGKFCTVQGCPFPHKISQMYDWYDIDEMDTDFYNILQKMENGDSTLYTYNDLILLDNARKLRASSPTLTSLVELLQTFEYPITNTKKEQPISNSNQSDIHDTKESKLDSTTELKETQTHVSRMSNELQRLVPSSLKPSDEKDGLVLYHQNNVNNSSLDVELECRGLIVKDKTILVKTFPTAREISVGHPNYHQWVKEALPFSIILKSYEGSLLRVWKCPGEEQWRISTVRKIDAGGSRWNSSPSFSDRLIESIQLQTKKDFSTFCNLLNPDYVYTFWLTTDPKTKSICKNDAQYLYSLGCFDRSKDFEYHLCTFSGIPFPPRIETYVFTPEELELALIDSSNKELSELKIQGYIILSLRGEMLKVSSNKYRDMYLIRGRNVSNKFVKYLELHDKPSRNSFLELYPEEIEHFQQLDRKMNHLINVLYMLHQKDLKRKRLPLVEKEEYKVYRRLFSEKCTVSYTKEEIYHLICKTIQTQGEEKGDFGLDVLRSLESNIQMLPLPNVPQTVPSKSSYYPQEIRYGNRGQYKKKNIHHAPHSYQNGSSLVTFSKEIKASMNTYSPIEVQFGTYTSYKKKMIN